MTAELQRWRRLGRLYAPSPGPSWRASHAACPVAHVLADGRVRIFFSTRNADNRSSLASVDADIDASGGRLIGPVRGPLLGVGERGAFDADGVMATSFVARGDTLIAYYLGWTVLRNVPFTNCIGLAIGDAEGEGFERQSRAPIVGRSDVDPLTLGYPWVLRDTNGWRMWYGTHTAWEPEGVGMTHVIRRACSLDGIAWRPDADVAIPLAGNRDPAEFAVSRPVVLASGSGLGMWYARRNPRYRLGFATSDDGLAWRRADDAVCFLGSPDEWERQEQTYPHVFDHGGRRFMLFNGDGYGRSGFGLAVLEES